MLEKLWPQDQGLSGWPGILPIQFLELLYLYPVSAFSEVEPADPSSKLHRDAALSAVPSANVVTHV